MDFFTPAEITPFLNTLLIGLGYILAAVSYYAGALILAMPFPSPRLKSLANALMRDGATTAVVVTVFSAPLSVIRLIGMLGFESGDAAYENSFYPWLGIEKGVPTGEGLSGTIVSGLFSIIWTILGLLIVQLIIVVVFSLIAAFLGGLVSSWLGRIVHAIGIGVSGIFGVYVWWRTLLLLPALFMVPIAVYLLYCIFFFAEFIRHWAQPMILFGALTYGLPFRIGRRVGASLIALSIVFYVGLPLMPAFVNAFASPDTASQYIQELQAQYVETQSFIENAGYPNVYFAAYPCDGKSGNYLLYITDGYRLWKVWTDENGERLLFFPTGSYRIYSAEYMGIEVGLAHEVEFRTSKTLVTATGATPNVQEVRVPLEIYEFTIEGQVGAQAFISLKHSSNVRITSLEEKGWGWSIEGYSTEDGYSLAFFIPHGTSFSLQVDSHEASFYVMSETDMGRLYRYEGFEKGSHKFSFVIQSVVEPPKQEMEDVIPEGADPTHYVPPEIKEEASAELTKFFFVALVMPQFYIWVILILVSVGVARLLGGHEFGRW